MKIELPADSTMITDAETDEAPEQPIIVCDYEGSGGIGLISFENEQIYIPYRMVKEVAKQMLEYSKPKKKK